MASTVTAYFFYSRRLIIALALAPSGFNCRDLPLLAKAWSLFPSVWKANPRVLKASAEKEISLGFFNIADHGHLSEHSRASRLGVIGI